MPVLLLPAGLLALYLLYIRFFHAKWNEGLRVTLAFEERTVTEGEKATLTEVVENTGLLPLHTLQVGFRLANGLRFLNAENMDISDRTSVNDVFSLGRFERVTRRLEARCERRGYYRILQTSVQASDLFSSHIHYVNLPQYTSLSVLPGRISGEHYELPVSMLFGDIYVKKSLFEDRFSMRGIRDYSDIDPWSSVNWKATAHTGGLKVNIHDRTAGERLCIFLNLEPPAALYNEDLLEDGIRLAGTLAEEASSYDIPVRLLTNGRDILTEGRETVGSRGYGAGAGHVRGILEDLARVDLTSEPETFSRLLERERGLDSRDTEGVCYVVVSTSVREQSTTAIADFAQEMGRVTWFSPVSPDMPMPPIPADRADMVVYRRMVRR